MKILKYIGITGLAVALLTACDDDDSKRMSVPVMSNVTVTPQSGLTYGDSISVTASVADEITPLSTLEVQVIVADVEVYRQSIRTKGNASDTLTKFKLPFAANAENNGEVTIKLESINVDGYSVSQTETLHAARPALGATLYVITENDTIALEQDASNENLYLSTEGSYPNEIVGKIATSEDLATADWVWVSSLEKKIVVGSEDGTDITLSDPSFDVKQISFNAMTFELEFIGTILPNVKFNSTMLLIADDGRFHGEVEFTKGETVTVEGIASIASAYNPDFFDYEDGVLTFKAPSGKYQVVYWGGTVNYMWLRKDGAVYPEALWLTGHGIGLPTFINDVTNIYWAWDDWSSTSRQNYIYCPQIGEGKYQATMYVMNTAGDSWWLQCEFKLFRDKSWDHGFSSEEWGYISSNFKSSSSGNFVYTDDLTEGLYRVTIDMNGGEGDYFLIAQKIR